MKRLLSVAVALTIISFPQPSSCGQKEKIRLNVQGMHCASCVSMVKKSVRKVSGIESVVVDLERGIVEVECDSAKLREQTITEAIQRMGYKVALSDTNVHQHALPTKVPLRVE